MVSQTEFKKFIKRLGSRRTQLTKLVQDLKEATGGERIDAVRAARSLDAAKEITEQDDSLDLERIRLLEACQTSARSAFLQLTSDIQDICERHKWRIDGEWPTFYVQLGIQIEIDEKKNTVGIGGKTLPGLCLREIEKTLEQQVTNLLPRNHSSAKFINLLANAYDRSTNQTGGQAPLVDVYRWVVILSQSERFWRDARSDHFAGFTADQFRAQFSRALEEGQISTSDGRELRLFPPIDPKDAIFMYQPAEGRFGFVGRIEFTTYHRMS